MAFDSLSISNAIIQEASNQGLQVTPMQLQKLLYFANGWHLEMRNGEPLVSNPFKAWQFGPVEESVYHEFKRFGSGPITALAKPPFPSVPPYQASLTAIQQKLVSDIVSIYGRLSGPQMSNLTHRDGTPWHKTWASSIGRGDTIKPDLIKAEFDKLRAAENG